eukprot:scaffold473302_cov67-Attheya_sp.AAC.1
MAELEGLKKRWWVWSGGSDEGVRVTGGLPGGFRATSLAGWLVGKLGKRPLGSMIMQSDVWMRLERG